MSSVSEAAVPRLATKKLHDHSTLVGALFRHLNANIKILNAQNLLKNIEFKIFRSLKNNCLDISIHNDTVRLYGRFNLLN